MFLLCLLPHSNQTTGFSLWGFGRAENKSAWRWTHLLFSVDLDWSWSNLNSKQVRERSERNFVVLPDWKNSDVFYGSMVSGIFAIMASGEVGSHQRKQPLGEPREAGPRHSFQVWCKNLDGRRDHTSQAWHRSISASGWEGALCWLRQWVDQWPY